MPDLLTSAALFILVTVAIGLFRVLRSEIAVERMMAVQLLGTGGAAAALLLGAAASSSAMVDVALLLMLLAAFSCCAFVLGETESAAPAAKPEDGP